MIRVLEWSEADPIESTVIFKNGYFQVGMAYPKSPAMDCYVMGSTSLVHFVKVITTPKNCEMLSNLCKQSYFLNVETLKSA